MVKLEFPLGLLIGFGTLLIISAMMLITFYRRRTIALAYTNLSPLLRAHESLAKRGRWRRFIPVIIDLFMILLLSVILSRPHMVMKVPAKGYAIVIVLDVSGSMRAKDFKPSRLEAAKSAAKFLVEGLKGNPEIGVITFNNTVRVIAVPTSDKRAVLRAIDSIKVAIGGTAMGDAIASAIALLTSVDAPSKFIVLLSDGQSNQGMPPLKAAEMAKRYKITIYTIGIGTTTGAFIPNVPYRVTLDEETLKRVASLTGGEYYYAANRNQLYNIFSKIRDKVGFKKGKVDVSYVFAMIAMGLIFLKWLVLALVRYAEL